MPARAKLAAMRSCSRSARAAGDRPARSAATVIGVPCWSDPETSSTRSPASRWWRAATSAGREAPARWPRWRGPDAYGQATPIRTSMEMVLSLGTSRAAGVPLVVEQGSAQEVAQLALLVDRQLAQARWRLGQPVEQAHSQGGALLGQHQRLYAPVARRRTAPAPATSTARGAAPRSPDQPVACRSRPSPSSPAPRILEPFNVTVRIPQA